MTKKRIEAAKNNDTMIEHIRQLAWTGQHTAAIDSATQALAALGDVGNPEQQEKIANANNGDLQKIKSHKVGSVFFVIRN